MEISVFWLITSTITAAVFACGLGYFWGNLGGYTEGLQDGKDMAVRSLVKAGLLSGEYLKLTKEYCETGN